MSWFADILGNWRNEKTDDYLSFGRYSDAYKSQESYESWDVAVTHFENGEILDCFEKFFDYLINNQENLAIQRNEASLNFHIFQGSKKIQGTVDKNLVRAEAVIAETKELELGFLRLLVERNFGLKYSRFALDEKENITIIFDSSTLDCSPFKFYYALKELALTADKMDDILIDEFRNGLKEINTGHIKSLAPEHIDLKVLYVKDKLQSVLDYYELHDSDPRRNPGGISYMLLSACYKIDYLTQPEGYILESVERIQRLYFSRNDLNMEEKNLQIRKEYEKILERSNETLAKEFYQSLFTFGITKPAGEFQISQIFYQDWNNFNWYLDNDLEDVAVAIAEYIVGYSLFNFAPPQPLRELLHLFYHIMENRFFQDLAYEDSFYNVEDREFNERAIKRELNAIENRYEDQLENFVIDNRKINFDSKGEFAKSYLLMMNELKFE